jgi:hypothetical protein
MEAAVVELGHQVAADKERLLIQTVAGDRPECAGSGREAFTPS